MENILISGCYSATPWPPGENLEHTNIARAHPHTQLKQVSEVKLKTPRTKEPYQLSSGKNVCDLVFHSKYRNVIPQGSASLFQQFPFKMYSSEMLFIGNCK